MLLVNQYFWPDMAATAQLLTDLAEDLAAAGWDVTVLAGRGSYAPGRPGRLPGRERHGKVEIRRVRCTNFGRGNVLGRLVDYITFLAMAGAFVAFSRWTRGRAAGEAAPGQQWRAGAGGRPVVVCLSTPPLLALVGLAAQARGAGFVVKVEDLYPEVAVALGTFGPGSLAARFFAAVSRLVLGRADAVVALDEGMRRRLVAAGARRVEVIPNWADGQALAPDVAAGQRGRAALAVGDSFVVLYAGNLGLAHRFDAVAAAARRLAAAPAAGGGQVTLLFVGSGPRLGEVRQWCRDLPNVRFLPYQPREALRELYNAADVHLVTLRDEASGLLVPSKVAAALACGKPVVLVGATAGTVAAELRAAGAGWCCPHDPAAVAALLAALAEDPARVAEAGRRARELFEVKYDRKRATGRWQGLLGGVAGVSPAGDGHA